MSRRPWDRKQRAPVPAKKDKKALDNTGAFIAFDHQKSLFPLQTTRILIDRGADLVNEYVEKCLDEADVSHSFLPQLKVYAAKPERHLRRAVKLDPVAEFYLYDVVFRNRRLFRKPHVEGRTHYGYRFEEGMPIPATDAYKAFRGALAQYGANFKYSLSLDVASYFNSLYHHDVVGWFAELGALQDDVEGLGQFLRQIRSGRSIDCLPQGIYPAKMMGNDFLRFVDNYFGLQSEKYVRFMDDITIFSNSEKSIWNDFELIQRLLGEKGLSVNPAKTVFGQSSHQRNAQELDAVKQSLLRRRRLVVAIGYAEDGSEEIEEYFEKHPLTRQEIQYIDSILVKPELEEEDAELILTLMFENVGKAEKRVPEILSKFPHLVKTVYSFSGKIENKDLLADALLQVLNSGRRVSEFELFWFGWMLESHLMQTAKASEIISKLYENQSSTVISRAKILEIPDRRFGLPDLRDQFLNGGQSDWSAWASAVGARDMQPIGRNYRMKYFGGASGINHLISRILSQ